MGLVNTGLIGRRTNRNILGSNHPGFLKSKPCHTSLVSFSSMGLTGHMVKEERSSMSALVFKKRTGSFLDDLILPTYYSSIATFSHKIPSMWELICFTELYLEADRNQKHKTDWKAAISSNCQICVWALCHWFQPCGESGRDSLDSAGWGDVCE